MSLESEKHGDRDLDEYHDSCIDILLKWYREDADLDDQFTYWIKVFEEIVNHVREES